MNAIDKYLKARRSLEQFNSWTSLIGNEYFGGTRGRGGEFGKIVSASGSLTIYHQEYDGAQNYHKLDPEFIDWLGSAMVTHSGLLIETIREKMSAELETKKVLAAKLAAELEVK